MTDPTPGPGLHGRPTSSELIEAVREFLERDVMSAQDRRVAFHARVAVNALRIVERELADGGAAEAAHRRRLDDLGLADDHALAAAIRSGELDGRWDEVLGAVAAGVADKVAIANPGYAD